MRSEVEDLGPVALPAFTGTRWMMMPFRMWDVQGTIPAPWWWDTIARLVELSGVSNGVGYITIDEARVEMGETHRRPGLHVDGVGPDGRIGGWGGGGGYAASGMLVLASHAGCVAWRGEFDGWPGPNGDCDHLEPQVDDRDAIPLLRGRAYRLSPTTLHKSTMFHRPVQRQFVRLSLPSDAPWYEGYTRNPTGVEPTGPIHPPRAEFMGFRA